MGSYRIRRAVRLATVVSAIVGLLALLIEILAWQLPRAASSPMTVTSPPASAGIAGADEENASTSESAAESPRRDSPPHSTQNRSISASPPTWHSATPTTDSLRYSEVSLAHGEQATVLQGRLGLGLMFNRIGPIQFPTLRVSPAGGQVTNHALLSGPERFRIIINGQAHQIVVTKIDTTNLRLTLRVE